MVVKLHLDFVEGNVRRDAQKPGAEVAFVDLFRLARHRIDPPQFTFTAHSPG